MKWNFTLIKFVLLAIFFSFVSGCGGDSQYKVMEDEADEFKKLYILLSYIKNADDAKAKKGELEEIANRLAELNVRSGKFPELGLNEEGPKRFYHYRSEAIVVFGKKLDDEEISAVLKVEFESIKESFRDYGFHHLYFQD